jgi:hypothetical protein
MTFTNILLLYLTVGTVCAMCFEILMKKFDLSEDTGIIERFTWILLWPYYVLIFFWGMRK